MRVNPISLGPRINHEPPRRLEIVAGDEEPFLGARQESAPDFDGPEAVFWDFQQQVHLRARDSQSVQAQFSEGPRCPQRDPNKGGSLQLLEPTVRLARGTELRFELIDVVLPALMHGRIGLA